MENNVNTEKRDEQLKIAKKIRVYKDECKKANDEIDPKDFKNDICQKRDMAEMRYQTYLEAIRDILGFSGACDILELSHETVQILKL